MINHEFGTHTIAIDSIEEGNSGRLETRQRKNTKFDIMAPRDRRPPMLRTPAGYGRAQDESFYSRQRELLSRIVAESDVVITGDGCPRHQFS